MIATTLFVGAPYAVSADDVIVGPPRPALGDPCSQLRQDAGLCLGFITTDESQDPVLAAIASAFAAGNLSGVYTFFMGALQDLDASEVQAVDAAFAVEAQEEGEGAAVIYAALGMNLPGSDTVTGVGVDTPVSGRVAKEAKHGNCCATSAYTWEWEGREINYGYCEQATEYSPPYCESLGHFTAHVVSNITYFEDVFWRHDFWPKSGHTPFLDKLTVKIKRDIANKADPTVNNYSCASGGFVPLSCEQSRVSPIGEKVSGNYYYVQLDADVSCKCGKPMQHLQIQTRRWYVSDLSAYYPAYDNGG